MSQAHLTTSTAWRQLEEHAKTLRTVHLRDLFATDPGRGERMVIDELGLYFDYSKHRVTDETLRLLVQLAEERGLRERIDAMFRGEKINVTEQRRATRRSARAARRPHLR